MDFELENKISKVNTILEPYYIYLTYPQTSVDYEKPREASLCTLPKNYSKMLDNPFRITIDCVDNYLKFYLSFINYENDCFGDYIIFLDEINKVLNDIILLNELNLPYFFIKKLEYNEENKILKK